MSAHDPWDDTPSAIDEDDEPGVVDPDEVLARALHRARHGGGTHILGSWGGIWHGLRAGDAKLRIEAERAALAERVQVACSEAVAAVRAGAVANAEEALRRALDAVITSAPAASKERP